MDLLYSRYARLASPIGRECVFMTMFIHMLEVTTAVLVGLLAFQVYRCYQAYYQSLTLSGVDQENRLPVPTMATRLSALKASVVTAPLQTARVKVEQEPSLQPISSLSVSRQSISSLSKNHSVAPSEKILNDYIGEFFNEEPKTDIQAFKTESSLMASVTDAKSMALDEASSNILVEQAGLAVNEPILADELEVDAVKREILANIETQKTLSEDEFIKVEQELLIPENPETSYLEPVIIESTRALNVPTLIDAISFDEEEADSVITVIPLSSSQAGEPSDKVMSDKVVHAMLDEANLVCVS